MDILKRFFLAVILIALLSALAQTFFPWWTMPIAAGIIGFAIPLRRVASWFAGLLSVFCLWLGYAIFLSHSNNGILAGRMAELLGPLTGGKVFRLYFLTAAVGGLIGSFGALTGRLAAIAFLKNSQQNLG